MRVPTEKQYALMRPLGNPGVMLVCGKRREIEPLVRRGWVTAEERTEDRAYPFAWVRITVDGLRAIAAAAEKYGLGSSPRDKSASS